MSYGSTRAHAAALRSGDTSRVLAELLEHAPGGVLLLHLDGRLVHANPEAIHLLGLDANALLIAHRGDLFALAGRLGALGEGGRDEVERVVVRADGVGLRLRFGVVRLRDEPGRPALAAAFLTDVASQPPADRADAAVAADTLATNVSGSVLGATGRHPGTRGSPPVEHLRAARDDVLRRMAAGDAPHDVLRAILGLIEEQLPGAFAALATDDGMEHAGRAWTHGRLPADLPQAAVSAALRTGGTRTESAAGGGRPSLGPARVITIELDANPELSPVLNRVATPALWVAPVPPVTAEGQEPLAHLVVAVDRAEPPGAFDAEVLAAAGDLAAIVVRRLEDERLLVQRALHDELTGLANRHLFLDRLEQAINRARRRGRNLALMFLDLDRFKSINDNLGHEAGDSVLRDLAERLRQLVRPEDTVARFGGDEFVVLVEHVVDEEDVALIAERLERSFDAPFVVAGTAVQVTASVGVTIAKGGDDDAATLLRHADTAMYRAKDLGRNRLELFDESLREELERRSLLGAQLRRALDAGELVLEYQPVFDLARGSVVVVEALLRWEHPQRGRLDPVDFLAVAEESGLIVPIGWWVLDQALADLKRWDDTLAAGGSHADPRPAVAVNLSPRQVAQPDLASRIGTALSRAGVAASRLVIEITESSVLDDLEAVGSNLARLRSAGVRLALDDFGTGFSSLASLHRMVLDVVKIDRSYVQDVRTGGDRTPRASTVAAVAGMAVSMGVAVVAEGVDDATQLTELAAMGCDWAQGNALGRPVTAAALAEVLRTGLLR